MEQLLKSQIGFVNARRHAIELLYLEVFRDRFDEAIINPQKKVDYLNARRVRIYNKGYLVLRALEGLLGRETFFKVLREAYARYRHKIITTEDFRAVAEEISGQNLKNFFDHWLYGAAFLDIAVERFASQKISEGYEATVFLSKQGDANYPVTVRATTIQEEVLETTWAGDAPQGAVTFKSSSPIKAVYVDPQEMSPDINRFNNHYPRRILVHWPFAGGEIKEKLSLDAYVIEISPLGISGRFRTDQQWSLSLLPAVDTNKQLRWNALGILRVDWGRSFSVDTLEIRTSLTQFDPATRAGNLDLRLSSSWTFYEHPPTGVAGRYWWPANTVKVSMGALGELSRLVSFVGLDYTRSDLYQLFMQHTFSLQVGQQLGDQRNDEPFWRLGWTGFKRFRLAPRVCLDANVTVGTVLGTLPEPFKFKVTELESFKERELGDRKAFGELRLRLPPLARDLDFSLLNLAKLDQIGISLFVRGGRAWTIEEPIRLDSLKAEVGVELNFVVLPLANLSVEVTAGYAQPILGAEARGRSFIKFSLKTP